MWARQGWIRGLKKKKKKIGKPSSFTYIEIIKILSWQRFSTPRIIWVVKQALLNDTGENADWTDSPFWTLFDPVIPLLRFNSWELTRDLKICVQKNVTQITRKRKNWFSNVQLLAIGASLVAQIVQNLPAIRETSVLSLGWEDPLEKGMATLHSSILAWRIPWTEKPGGLQPMGSQRAGHKQATNTFTFSQLWQSHIVAYYNDNRGREVEEFLIWEIFIDMMFMRSNNENVYSGYLLVLSSF